MPSVIEFYEKLSSASDDKTRARIIAEAFEALEERYPQLGEVATQRDLSETELRLTKEIEQIRAETEQIRAEIKDTELRLQREIAGVRKEVSEVAVKVETVRASLIKWTFLFWASQFGALVLLVWRLWGGPPT